MIKVKICGLRRMEDIAIVNELKPDYAGFVFAPSFRQVDIHQAYELRARMDPIIQAVGVFVNEPIGVIETLYDSGIIDFVQLHGDESREYMEELADRVGAPVIRAIRVKSAGQIEEAQKLPCDYLLLDTYTKGTYGGTGKTFDRSLIPHLEKRFFLAGGLNEENVCKAVKECHPFAVDVSSAVETDGVKDQKKIQTFIERIRKNEKR